MGCQPEAQRKTKPSRRITEQPQQLPQVCTRCRQDNVDRVAFQSAQEATPHAMVALEMPDLRLDGASPTATLSFAARDVL
jgi:hypothetical protein